MVKTYLLVTENICRRCQRRWTSSAVCDRTSFPLSESLPVEELSGYFTRTLKHQACFSCMEPSTPNLPLHYAHKEPPVTWSPDRKAGSAPARVATLDDILED